MKLGCWVSSNYPSTVHSASWRISLKKIWSSNWIISHLRFNLKIFNLNHLYSHNESLKKTGEPRFWTTFLPVKWTETKPGCDIPHGKMMWYQKIIPQLSWFHNLVQLILHVKRAPTRGFDPLRPRFHRCSEGPTLWGSSDSFGHPHANRPPNRDVRSTCPESEGCGPFSIILLAYRLFRWCSRVVSLWDLGEHKATRSGEVSW